MMKSLKYIFLTLLFYLCSSMSNMSHASAVNDKELSFEFNNISLSDALIKLKDAYGVDIVLKRAINHDRRINKKYDNVSLDDIILDIFRDDNLTASFRYSDDRLTAIGIWLLPRIKGGDNKPALYYESRDSGNTATQIKSDTVINKRDVTADSAAYFATASNDYANNEVNINSVTNVTTEIPSAPEFNETLGLEAPPMPPGM